MIKLLMLVKTSSTLFIGQMDSNTIPSVNTVLEQPRMVFANHETRSIVFAPLIGEPESIKISGTIDYMYQNKDIKLAEHYYKELEESKEILH